MIEKLNWDSEFFGYPVGKIVLEKGATFAAEAFKSKLSDFKLVYIFSPQELELKESSQIFLADKKVVFLKQLDKAKQYEIKAEINEYDGPLSDDLLELVLESGIYSRFRVDKHFKNKEFERLYTEWILKSLDGGIAEKVYVSRVDREMAGFITVGLKNGRTDIGLISVNEKFRGMSIASSLISVACNYSIAKSIYKIQVVTQGDNIPAMKLYQHNGFEIEEITYIYHYWNDNFLS